MSGIQSPNYYGNMAKCGKPTCTEESNVKVSDKRSMFNEVWSKHKKTIMIIGALGIGYFAYKKFIKK
tara:strand:+ start:3468 stop:3668 length:201 start_codon:yes stop_codon:yes gene_type:complete